MIKKLIFLAVFVCVFCIHYEVDATKGTDVKGILRTDTVWTKEGSPYKLVDNIQVGGKLTIEPGVSVVGNNKQISIFGELNVLGRKDENVRLMSVDLKSGDHENPGKINISYSHLFDCNFNIYENFNLKDSWVDGSIKQSTFYPQQKEFSGYYLYYFGVNASIERNVFSDILPISVQDNSRIINNVFMGSYKLNISGNQNIFLNFNSFLGENSNIINLGSNYNIDNIENNFWNTNNKEEILGRIYDANDDLSIYNLVNVKTYLTKPHENSPSTFPYQAPKLTSAYTQKSTSVKGIAEPDSLLHFSYFLTNPYEFGGDEGWIFVDSSGEFKIDSISSGNHTMRLTSLKNGITSNESNIVAMDNISPQIPIVDDISDHTQEVTGSAERGAMIVVKKGAEILGTSKINSSTKEIYDRNNVNFSLSIPKQDIGTKLTVYAVDLAGNTSEAKEVTVLDGTPLLAPIVDDITDQAFIAKGKASPGTIIEIRNGYWIIGSGTTNSKGYYSVPIVLQPAGTKLVVFSTNLFENVSNFTEVTVRHETASFEPRIINEVTDQTRDIIITAEPLSKIVFMTSTQIVEATSNGYGLFELIIGRKEAGTVLKFIVTDTLGNVKVLETVVKDVTAPIKPQINEITDQTTIVSGYVDGPSTVSIMVNSEIIGTGRVKPDASYSIKVARQKAGSKVKVFAIDTYGNVGGVTETIVKDVAPVLPKVYEVTDQMTTVSGKTESAAKVTVKVGGKVLSSSQADIHGNFSLTISRQVAGVKLSVVSTDSAGNTSEEKIVTVIDVTAPEAPKVDVVTDQMTTVSGQTESGAEVIAKVGDKTLGTTKAGIDGIYSLTIPRQVAGVKVSVIATDLAGNTSEETIIIVKDVTAPEAPKVDALTDQMTKVSGQAEANAKVTVKVDGKVFGTTSAGTDGIYSLTIPRQAAGVKVNVVATDLAGNTSEETIIIVKDVTAPEAPKVDVLTDQMTKVSGQAEANAKVTVKVDEKVFGTTSVGTDGIYSLTIPRQAAGVKVSVVATDAAGNTSAEITLLVKDVTSPPPPKVYEVTDKAISVSGTAEAGSKILVKIGIKEIGNSIVNSDGTYKIQIAKQKAGVKLTVVAIDHYENISKSTEMIVKDTTPPLISSVGLVSDQSIVVSGKVESNVKVYVKVGSKLIGSALSGKGIYNIKIVKQKAGTKLTVYAVDSSGNQSKSKQVTVLDRTPPATPIVNKITNTSKMISGKAESNAKVFVYYNSKKIAEGNADSKGNFKVKIKVQKKGAVLKVYAQDKSSNRSKEKTLKVI